MLSFLADSRLGERLRVLYFVMPVTIVAVILAAASVVSRNIADDTAVRMSRQYAIETAANLQVFMTPHMRLMGQMAYSAAISHWLANEDDVEAKQRAFEAMMGNAAAMPDAYFMFTVYDSLRGYDFSPGLSFDEFEPWGTLAGGEISQWFFDTIAAEAPFIINIQRTRPDEHGEWSLYIWTNHRIYYQGEIVGVFTLGSPFANIYAATFYGFDRDRKRGYIIDRYGMVRLDSTGILETEIDGLPNFQPVPEAEANPQLADAIDAHLLMLEGGLYPLGTQTCSAIHIRGAFRYASIAPIVGTDWSIIVLSSHSGEIDPRYIPIIAISMIMFMGLLFFGAHTVRVQVVRPLLQLAKSAAGVGTNVDAEIFGTSRPDEIGDISRAIQTMLREISERNATIKESELTQKLLHNAPFFIEFWDSEETLVDCNVKMLETLQCPSKEALAANFYDYCVPVQPCGTPTEKLNHDMFNRTMKHGIARGEWTFLLPDGSVLPVEATWVRITHMDAPLIIVYSQDLRPLKMAAERERELELKLVAQKADYRIRTMFDLTPLLIDYWNRDCEILDCNRYAMEFFGFKNKQDYIDNDRPNAQFRKQYLNEIFETGSGSFKFSEKKPNGETVHLKVQGVRTRINDSDDDVVITYARDVTELTEAREKEREITEYKNALFDASPMLIDVWDEDCNLINCNMRVMDVLGAASREDYINNIHTKYDPPTQPCGTASKVLYARKFEIGFAKGYVKFEWTHLDANGAEVPIEVTYVSVLQGGKPVLVGYKYDLRRRKLFEEQQRERQAQELTQKLLDTAPILIETWTADAKHCVGCNRYLMDTFGLESEGEYGTWWKKFSAPVQAGGTPMEELKNRCITQAAEVGISRAEWLFILPGGEELPVDCTLIRVDHAGTPIVIAYSIDQRPIKAAVRAEESNLAKSSFLARMSHEIRTPITAVLGLSEIQLRSKALTPKTEEAFTKIYNSSKSLLNIVNDILDLSRIESGKLPLSPEQYDVASLVTDSAQLHSVYAEYGDVNFQMYVDETLPARLIGDAQRIRQVITNLLTNAFKFTERGYVTLSMYCEPSGTNNFVTLVISIQDTGIGMTEAQVRELRGEYVRLHEHEMPFISGTGLGIPIVYSLVKLMNADFDIASEPGKGTKTTLRIPQEIVDEAQLGPRLAAQLQNFEIGAWSAAKDLEFEPTQMQGKVLVVDDVETNLHVAEAMLETFGVEVELCANARDAIKKIEDGNVYDIIFMDYMMPEMSGIEATQILRGMGYEQPIVALTANALKGQAEMFMKHGFSGFMSKPVDIKIFNSYLLRFVGEK